MRRRESGERAPVVPPLREQRHFAFADFEVDQRVNRALAEESSFRRNAETSTPQAFAPQTRNWTPR